MPAEFYIGIDVGSVSAKVVAMDSRGKIVARDYRRTHGLPLQTVLKTLQQLFEEFDQRDVHAVAVTGSGSARLAELLGGAFVNEIVAVAKSVELLLPDIKTVIEVGGEDSKLFLFNSDEKVGRPVLLDFIMNTLCAAGTGSFLDQQATRLGVHIEREFAELALRSKHPPRIAGRCSVFAKSDMIHLQQTATPVEDIVAGLCLALARNFKATLGKGLKFECPIAFIGGVAANAGMVRAFEQVLNLQEGELVVPEEHFFFGALGAIQKVKEDQKETQFRGLGQLEEFLALESQAKLIRSDAKSILSPLSAPVASPSKRHADSHACGSDRAADILNAYLGIDVGSISTNLVLIDDQNRVISKRYLMTASRPIEAVRHGLEEIGTEIGDGVKVCGVGTTGSGRYLIGDLTGADVVRNEITAQATAALEIDPAVDTIFEIGGQDSKFISLDQGAIVDFEMNKACAAGTGSFLEEQAERLGIDIKQEFACLALSAKQPVRLGDRCTVFMESDLTHYQQRGDDKPCLLAGLAYSIVENYLNRVVGTKRVGDNIFFQGGVAFNDSVVAAFESVLGKKVLVPPHHEVTGAIGVAILAREYMKERRSDGDELPPSKFKGFDLGKRNYHVETFECAQCANRCEIRRVKVDGEKPLFYGSRCERFEIDSTDRAEAHTELPDLFTEREQILSGENDNRKPLARTKGTVGLPFCLTAYEFLPFWRTFFHTLGFDVITSDKTSKTIIHEGVESVAAETCYPVKVAHGHIMDVLSKKPDFLFLPNIIDYETPEFGADDKSNFHCPFVQGLPYIAPAGIDLENCGVPVLAPALHLQQGWKVTAQEMASCAKQLRIKPKEIERALKLAFAEQERFYGMLSARGKEVLNSLGEEDSAVVLIGRPYNTCDSGVNLEVPKKLRKLGILSIPMDMLPLDDVPLNERWRTMYWRYGQRLLRAAKYIKEHPRLSAIYVTNFGCGPDSFLLRFFAHEMGDKPFLQLEIDEHSADAGIITRCEAFLDTLNNNNNRGLKKTGKRITEGKILTLGGARGRKIYVPFMASQAYGFAAAMRSAGIDAEVMDETDEVSLELGKHFTSGRECYPALLTVGDMVRQTQRSDFDPKRAAFFMARANGPCRFGQYHQLFRIVLDDLGLHEVPVVTLDQDRNFNKDVGNFNLNFEKAAWLGIIAFDALTQMLFAVRPYEKNAGETESVFEEAGRELCREIERKGDPFGSLRRAKRQFDRIERKPREERPLIGVIGEIYIRSNRFSNDYLIENIEALGGEVLMPPMGEWIYYVTVVRKWRSRWRRAYGNLLRDVAREFIQRRIERRAYASLGLRPDSHPKELFGLAAPYCDEAFQGEAILSIGKALEYLLHYGASGIINVMPFTCMPGMVVTALLKRLKEKYPEIPVLNLSYTGQQALNTNLRLEAFIHQAREVHKSKI